MSDTPRTDSGVEFDNQDPDSTMRFARQLERELNAANQEIDRLSGVIESMSKGTTESQWLMVKEASEMDSKYRVAMDRVKLLERLGNNMAEYMVDGREVDDWKNANPESWKRRDDIDAQRGRGV